MFCYKCGAEILEGMQFCGKCGTSVSVFENASSEYSCKSSTVTAILALLLGGLGIHDFYTGNISKGIIKVVLSFFGLYIASTIWTLVDLFRLAKGTYTDGDGDYLEPAHWVILFAIIAFLLSVIAFLCLVRILVANM